MASSEAILRKFAYKIVLLGWQAPALFFLEAHKPFTTMFHTGALLLAPLATPLFGLERVQPLQELLSEHSNVERLMELIEEYSRELPSQAGLSAPTIPPSGASLEGGS